MLHLCNFLFLVYTTRNPSKSVGFTLAITWRSFYKILMPWPPGILIWLFCSVVWKSWFLNNWWTTGPGPPEWVLWNDCIRIHIVDLPSCPVVKNPPANAGDTGSVPGLERYHMLTTKPLHHIYRNLCSRTREPQLPGPRSATREATAMRNSCTSTQERIALTCCN